MHDDSPVAGDKVVDAGDSSLLSSDIETRKYIIHLFLGYSEEIENGVLKKNIVFDLPTILTNKKARNISASSFILI